MLESKRVLKLMKTKLSKILYEFPLYAMTIFVGLSLFYFLLKGSPWAEARGCSDTSRLSLGNSGSLEITNGGSPPPLWLGSAAEKYCYLTLILFGDADGPGGYCDVRVGTGDGQWYLYAEGKDDTDVTCTAQCIPARPIDIAPEDIPDGGNTSGNDTGNDGGAGNGNSDDQRTESR